MGNPGNPNFGKIESESGGTSSFRKKEGRIPREANFGRPIKPPSYTIANSMDSKTETVSSQNGVSFMNQTLRPINETPVDQPDAPSSGNNNNNNNNTLNTLPTTKPFTGFQSPPGTFTRNRTIGCRPQSGDFRQPPPRPIRRPEDRTKLLENFIENPPAL